MTRHQAFLADIIARPDDDTPRLIYADWLDDRDESGEDHDPARAEFIRVQIDLDEIHRRYDPVLHRMASIEDDQRSWALVKRQRELLLAAKPGQWSGFPEHMHDLRHFQWDFRRGFVESITLPAESWYVDAENILTVAPIQEVTLTTMPEIRADCSDMGGTISWGQRVVFQRTYPRQIFQSTQAVVAIWAMRALWPKLHFRLAVNRAIETIHADGTRGIFTP